MSAVRVRAESLLDAVRYGYPWQSALAFSLLDVADAIRSLAPMPTIPVPGAPQDDAPQDGGEPEAEVHPRDRYPLPVISVTIPSYEDHGSVYTLTLSDGSAVELTDADDDYHRLANIIDRAFPTPGVEPPEDAEPVAAQVAQEIRADIMPDLIGTGSALLRDRDRLILANRLLNLVRRLEDGGGEPETQVHPGNIQIRRPTWLNGPAVLSTEIEDGIDWLQALAPDVSNGVTSRPVFHVLRCVIEALRIAEGRV